MINVCLNLKNINRRNFEYIKSFVKKAPKEINFSAVVNLKKYGKGFYKSLKFKKLYGMLGAVKTDIFIDFFKINYIDIAGIILNKNIFTVSVQEDTVESYVNLKIKDFDWKLIIDSYKKYEKPLKQKRSENKKKIAFVTPLNTDKSAIARFSLLTLKELCKKADVDVFSLERHFENNIGAKKIEYLTPKPYITHDYDAVISVLGDSIFHNKMFDYHLKYGSNALMHDSNVLNYSKELYGERYIPEVAKFYNNCQLSKDEAKKIYKDFTKLKVTGIEPVLEASKIFYTHSKKTYDFLSKENKNIVYLPFCIYSDLEEDKLDNNYKRIIKSELGFKEDDILIISLGGINNHKMSDIAAKAYLESNIDRDKVKFVFVGTLGSEYKEFTKLVAGNKSIKYFRKFVSDDMYKKYIYAADIAIQLRNSNLGQVSGALSDNISAGIYTISCEDLTESIEAPDYIIGTKGIPTVEKIVEKIEFAVYNKVWETDYKKQRDEYLKIHNFDNYTNIILNSL